MAGKHYIIATNNGYIVDNATGYPEEFATKQLAIKALAEIVRDAAERCRRSHKTCSVVGTARDGKVEIRVGGRQGYHLWDRFLINERTGSRKPRKESTFMRELRDAAVPSSTTGHARKKSPAQLQREIDEVLGKSAKSQKSQKSTQRKMDAFTRSYLETALWSSTDDEGKPLDRDYGISDFAPEALDAAIKVAADFQESNEDDLDETSGDSEQHGHDFWLTRNGHGAGFWDRGYGPVGDRLTKAAKAYGSEDIYVGDDGLLYFS